MILGRKKYINFKKGNLVRTLQLTCCVYCIAFLILQSWMVCWNLHCCCSTKFFVYSKDYNQEISEIKKILLLFSLQFVSGSLSVILRSVSLFSAGLFGCEVSADYPEYDTDIRRKHLHVFGEINYPLDLDQISWLQFHRLHDLM